LPGSTGAQKLLVTRVLEHLDAWPRTRKATQTQLDLVNAYTQLGEIRAIRTCRTLAILMPH